MLTGSCRSSTQEGLLEGAAAALGCPAGACGAQEPSDAQQGGARPDSVSHVGKGSSWQMRLRSWLHWHTWARTAETGYGKAFCRAALFSLATQPGCRAPEPSRCVNR